MKAPAKLKVIGYARVSTEEQVNSGVSLDAQVAKLKAYCDLHDLDLVEVIIDAGVSAKNLDRPGLKRGLQMLRTRAAEGLVVAKLDRLSRSVGDWNTLIEGYFGERAGKTLMSVADSIDTRTAAGRLVLNVLMSVAQWEREAIGERTRDALRYKKSQGVLLGASRPECRNLTREAMRKGSEVSARLRTEARAEAYEHLSPEVERMRAEGLSLRAIAAELNARGETTRNGAVWTAVQVSRLLSNLVPA